MTRTRELKSMRLMVKLAECGKSKVLTAGFMASGMCRTSTPTIAARKNGCAGSVASPQNSLAGSAPWAGRLHWPKLRSMAGFVCVCLPLWSLFYKQTFFIRHYWFLGIGVVASLFWNVAYGQVAGGAQQNAEQVQGYMQQQLQLEQERMLRESQNWGGGQNMQQYEKPRKAEVRGGGGCHSIKKIEVEGDGSVSLSPIIAQYEGRCLNAGDMEDLLRIVTDAYISRGYITTRAYLPEQDLSGGTLFIKVIEGRIERYQIDESIHRAGNINLYTTFPSSKGDVLNLRDIEQGIDQINSLPSNRATMQVLPGDAEGQSIVSVSNEPGSSWRAGITYDNTGQQATGKGQIGVSFGVDNPLGIGDGLRLSYQSANPQNYNTAYSNIASVNYMVPFGYNTFAVGYLATIYRQLQILPSGTGYLSNGYANNLFGSVSRVVYRDQTWKLNLSTTLTKKESGNFFADQLLQATSPSLSVWDIDASAMRVLSGWGMVSLGVGVTQGISLFGATPNRGILGSPQAQYQKTRQYLFFNLNYVEAPYALTWANQTFAQQSADVLYGSEQMLVIGPSAVRGFVVNFLSGNSAFYSRNDFSVLRPIALDWLKFSVKAYAGLDIGSVLPVNMPSNSTGKVSGATVGAALYMGGTLVDISYSKPLQTLAWMLPEPGVAYIRLRYDFDR